MAYYEDDQITLHHGDALDILRALPDASVDAVVTDPPYGLAELPASLVTAALTAWLTGDREHVPGGRGFLGREWDRFVPPPALWDECLRVLKPGGHLLAFAAPRTADLMAISIRLAGFQIRDSISWTFAQGFPKGADVGKAIDRRREDRAAVLAVTAAINTAARAANVGSKEIDGEFGFNGMASHWMTQGKAAIVPTNDQWARLRQIIGLTESSHLDEEIRRLNGRKGAVGENFAAREEIGRRHAGLHHGQSSVFLRGASEADAEGRVPITAPASDDAKRWHGWNTSLKPAHEPIIVARKSTGFNSIVANVLEHGTGALHIAACETDTGRWPANVVYTHAHTPSGADLCADGCVTGCPVAELDAQSGVLTSGANPTRRGSDKFRDVYGAFKGQAECTPRRGANSGGASRYFPVFRYEAKAGPGERPKTKEGDGHESVKPLALMRWLVQLVTPPGGTVLEPFAGSGTTIEACLVENFRCIAVEREAKYLPLIMARISKPIEPMLFGGVG